MNTEIGFLLLILVYKDDIFCVIIFLEETYYEKSIENIRNFR